jgi:hypothetical protein
MYFVTNRKYDSRKKGFEKLTKYINGKGQNELRLMRLTKDPTEQVELLKDKLSKKRVKELRDKFHLSINPEMSCYASLEVACNIFEEAGKACKNVVILVHGYNNDIKDIYQTAKSIEDLYNVIVVVFTWPSNGGGNVSGTLSYLEDKRDARGSADALNRFIDLIGKYHQLLTSTTQDRLKALVVEKHPQNPTKQRELLAELTLKNCSTTINLMCHSMGNYVFKRAILSTTHSEARKLIFDNIIMAAADTNNKDHHVWVDALSVRKSCYILINEKDFALSWSRRKPGEEQKARLGHYLKVLDAKKPYYIDVSNEKGVGNSHSYFSPKVADKNVKIKNLFNKLFSAKSVRDDIVYIPGSNSYKLK